MGGLAIWLFYRLVRFAVKGWAMKTCPTCGASADVLIVNVVCGTEFCHHCAARECPSFLPRFVLTLDLEVIFKKPRS
jgi:hypothetical protein